MLLAHIVKSNVARYPVLLVVALAACAEPNQGVVGAVDACSTRIAEYERAHRPRVSPVTGVDTGGTMRGASVDVCCPAEHLLQERELLNGRTQTLPVDAARFPWTGQCWDADGTVCDRCNLCPYGATWTQGTWVDTDRGQPTLRVDEHNRQANRLDIDGNTFRWRYKNRESGHWVDFRGYYYCSEPFQFRMGQPVRRPEVVFVPVDVSRGDGAPCVFDPRTAPAPHEPFPRIAIGEPLATSVDRPNGYEALLLTTGIAVELAAEGPYAPNMPYNNLMFCSPGSYIGPVPPTSAVPLETHCPELESFTTCWEADQR